MPSKEEVMLFSSLSSACMHLTTGWNEDESILELVSCSWWNNAFLTLSCIWIRLKRSWNTFKTSKLYFVNLELETTLVTSCQLSSTLILVWH
jgi:hypothetical protein